MVKRIALTGGPCAGKTTALVRVLETLSEAGYLVGYCEETATRLISQGLNPRILGIEFQRLILREQLHAEDLMASGLAAYPGTNKRILVCDRGIMDVAAYTTPEEFEMLIKEMGFNRVALLDRYQWVGHLVTAADGAETFYTKTNNDARSESIEEARRLDKRTQEAWQGHPHARYAIIDNATDFDGKLRRLRAAMERGLGIAEALQIERKFVLEKPPHISAIPPHEEIEIEQAYLQNPGDIEDRIRKWRHRGGVLYTRTFKLPKEKPLTRIRREEPIMEREYYRLRGLRILEGLEPLGKHRFCFAYANQHCRLDVFTAPSHLIGMAVLEIEPLEAIDKVKIPSFIGSVTEVTDDARYTNRRLYEERAPASKQLHGGGWRFWRRK